MKESGENPLVHYVLYGKREGRLPIKRSNNKEVNKLNKRIKNYKKIIDRQDRQIKRLQKNVTNQFSILEAYNKLFNDLYIFHETFPKGPLKDIQELCIELLLFFDKVCEKYDIPYWLDYGTLLGPVRHGGFLPWDDDIDLGMFKNVFDKRCKLSFVQKMRYNQKMIQSEEFRYCIAHCAGKKESPLAMKILRTHNYYLFWLFDQLVKLKGKLRRKLT